MLLYEHFLNRLWKEIEIEGPSFYKEVSELRHRREYYSNLCIQERFIKAVYSNNKVREYKLRSNLTGEMKLFCEKMVRNELNYLDYFRTKSASTGL